MHRSLTLSEIISSTLSNNNNNDELDNEYSRDKFVTNIGIGSIELLLSSLLLCYGIIFTANVGIGRYTVEDGLWITIIYISIYNITAPWSERLVGEWYQVNKNQKTIFRFIVFFSTCLLILGIVFSGYTLSYGICGGLAHRIVSTQLRFIAMGKYKVDEKKFECNVQPAKAICLLILPHLLLLLVDNYTIDQCYLIYAVFLANIIPASWIIRFPKDSDYPEEYPSEYSDMNRYRTLSVFSRQMEEMKYFSKSPNSTFSKSPHSTFSEPLSIEDEEEVTEDDTSADDSIQFFIGVNNDNADEDSGKIKQVTHQTVQFYYSSMGVNILPDIPEEPEIETEKDTDDFNAIDPKRLSRISAALEELNQRDNEKKTLEKSVVTTGILDDIKTLSRTEGNGNDECVNKELVVSTDILVKLPAVADEIKSIEYIHDLRPNNYRNRFKNFLNYPKYTCCQCSPYTLYLWKRRFRRARDFLTDHIFQPLHYSLTDLHFYPTLASKVTIILNSTIFITLAPHLFRKKNSDCKREYTFLLSYMAFSWCLFLVFLPLVVTFSKVRMRYTFSIGLSFTALSMLLPSKPRLTNDCNDLMITMSCLLYGFGSGMINYSENLVYKSLLNGKTQEANEGTLDTISGGAVILAYFIIYNSEIDIVNVFPKLSFYCYVILASFWMIVSSSKIYVAQWRKCYKK